MLRVVIADDDIAAAMRLRSFLREEQMPIEIIAEVGDGRSALETVLMEKPDLVFIDVQMPRMNGLEVVSRAKEEHSTAKFIVITAYNSFDFAQRALRLRADDILLKPISRDQLIASVNRAVGMQFSSNRQVNEILLYIGAHLHEPMTLQKIADQFFISSYHLSHLFKKYMGMTCIDCIHWMRIERAKELLRGTNLSIKEISERTGYSNLNNFYMHFKKLTGMTPKLYISHSAAEKS